MRARGYGSALLAHLADRFASKPVRKQRTMFRRKEKKPGYKVENYGNLIIECVQMPHSMVELDKTEYQVVTWTFRFRIEDSRILFEKDYIWGGTEDVAKITDWLKSDYTRVSSKFQAHLLFLDELSKYYGVKQ
jgi:hypothetical protein